MLWKHSTEKKTGLVLTGILMHWNWNQKNNRYMDLLVAGKEYTVQPVDVLLRKLQAINMYIIKTLGLKWLKLYIVCLALPGKKFKTQMQIFVFPLEGTTGLTLSMRPSKHFGSICVNCLPVQWGATVPSTIKKTMHIHAALRSQGCLQFMGYWEWHGVVQNTKEFREIKVKAQFYEPL